MLRLSEATAWPARHDDDGRSGVDPRFNTYRRSSHSTQCDTLAAIYPVVAKLVDVRFFRQTARQYLRACTSPHGDPRGFGSGFPQFLDSLRSLQPFPHVADVARLEWALHYVEHAPEYPHDMDLALLGRVSVTEWPRLRFQLHSATALVASRFPILHIWEAHQGRAVQQDVDLGQGGARLLVVRTSEDGVGTRDLSAGEYTLLLAFAAGRALEDAEKLVRRVEPTLNLCRTLARFIELDVVVGLRPAPV